MAKVLLAGKTLIITQKVNGEMSCRVNYVVQSEDISDPRSLEIAVPVSTQNHIKQFLTQTAIPQIKNQEGI